MRLRGPFLLALAACVASGQQKDPDSLFLTMRPDVLIRVKEHELGPENVNLDVLKVNYPPDLLQSQIRKLGRLLGGEARILYIQQTQSADDPSAKFLKASFSVSGIIDRQLKLYRLSPIAQAFAGAPEPFTIRGIQVVLENETGYAGDLAKDQVKGAWRAEAMRTLRPLPMLEYRIELLSQDPAKLSLPEKVAPKMVVSTSSSSSTSSALYALLAVVAIAAGVLVYLALLRVPARKRPE